MAVTFTDRQLLKRALVGLCASMGLTDAITTVGNADSEFFVFQKAAADGMASTATSETDLNIYLKRACILRSVTWTPQGGAVTNDNTNNFTATFSKRDSTGGNLTTVATLTNSITTYGASIAACKRCCGSDGRERGNHSRLYTHVLDRKNGSGVVVPISLFTFEVEWD